MARAFFNYHLDITPSGDADQCLLQFKSAANQLIVIHHAKVAPKGSSSGVATRDFYWATAANDTGLTAISAGDNVEQEPATGITMTTVIKKFDSSSPAAVNRHESLDCHELSVFNWKSGHPRREMIVAKNTYMGLYLEPAGVTVALSIDVLWEE